MTVYTQQTRLYIYYFFEAPGEVSKNVIVRGTTVLFVLPSEYNLVSECLTKQFDFFSFFP